MFYAKQVGLQRVYERILHYQKEFRKYLQTSRRSFFTAMHLIRSLYVPTFVFVPDHFAINEKQSLWYAQRIMNLSVHFINITSSFMRKTYPVEGDHMGPLHNKSATRQTFMRRHYNANNVKKLSENDNRMFERVILSSPNFKISFLFLVLLCDK